MFGGCDPPIRLHFERISGKPSPDFRPCVDCISQRLCAVQLCVSNVLPPKDRSRRASILSSMRDVNSIAYARIHGRCRAAKLQAAPRHRKCPVTISAAPSKQQRRRNAMAARGRRYQPRTSATMLSFSSSDQRRLRPVPTTSSLPTCAPCVRLEPVSKSPEEDNEASELYEAEEVLGVVFPTDKDAALPLNPSKEALHEPTSHIAA